jgi:dTDP-4-dehydrorhamnose 3,5-epimerase
MKFLSLPLSGAYLIEPEKHQDNRGYFARNFCTKEFDKHGLVTYFVQMSTSFNYHKGQIRGMHYQDKPHEETKIVSCRRGSVYDVIIDLRFGSDTFNQWYGVVLSEKNSKMLYIPKGFAHGYKTLEDSTTLFYMMDTEYVKTSSRERNYKDWGLFE